MTTPTKQVVLAMLATLVVSWARRPSPELSWMDHSDALDEESQPIRCFSGNCASAVGPSSAFSGGFDGDLDMDDVQQVDPPTADKRTTTLQEICDNIVEDRSLRAAMLPCPCELGYRPLLLGESHYPHHLNVVQCRQSPRCRTRSYRVPLLTRRSSSVQDASVDDAPQVPECLRKHWRFELKSIPVACDCVP